MMPLRCAIEVFIRHPGRELEWTRATFASLNRRRGLPVTQRICSVLWRNEQPLQPLEEYTQQQLLQESVVAASG
jgi:hypothetical protein